MKSVMVHAGLALAGTLVAWYVYTSDDSEEVPDEAVELLECGSFERASYTVPNRTVSVEAREDDSLWVVVESEPEEGEATTKTYLASESAEEWANHFDPFRALRSLGDVPEDEREPLGFDEESATFELRCNDGSQTYTVGGTAFGGDSRYVVSSEGGAVYLLSGPILSDLRSAETSLVQRDLHRFEMTEVDQLVVSAGDNSMTLKQRDRHDERAAIWVDAADPDARNDMFGNWIVRLQSLSIMNYLDQDASPRAEDGSEPETILSLTYQEEGGSEIETMELVRVENQPAEYYARTTTTRGWVQVPASTARQVENDGRTVVGLEPLERPEDAPPEVVEPDPEEGVQEGSDGADESTDAADPHGHGADPHGHGVNPQVPTPEAPPSLPPGHP